MNENNTETKILPKRNYSLRFTNNEESSKRRKINVENSKDENVNFTSPITSSHNRYKTDNLNEK